MFEGIYAELRYYMDQGGADAEDLQFIYNDLVELEREVMAIAPEVQYVYVDSSSGEQVDEEDVVFEEGRTPRRRGDRDTPCGVSGKKMPPPSPF